MKIINLLGGPGSGKSTLRAGLFYEMKMLHLNVEEASEYAKNMVFENRQNILKDQIYMLAKQNRRISRFEGTIDYVVTDSPILLSCIYADPDLTYNDSFQKLALDLVTSYDNINIFINKKPPYSEKGRNQNEEEADALSKRIKSYLISNKLSFIEFDSDNVSPKILLEYILGD